MRSERSNHHFAPALIDNLSGIPDSACNFLAHSRYSGEARRLYGLASRLDWTFDSAILFLSHHLFLYGHFWLVLWRWYEDVSCQDWNPTHFRFNCRLLQGCVHSKSANVALVRVYHLSHSPAYRRISSWNRCSNEVRRHCVANPHVPAFSDIWNHRRYLDHRVCAQVQADCIQRASL